MSNTDKEDIQKIIEHIQFNFKNTVTPERFYMDVEMTPTHIKSLEQYCDLLETKEKCND